MNRIPNINLISFNLNEEGFKAVYYRGERLLYLVANPEEAASIFLEQEFINDYTGSGDLVSVEWETCQDYPDHNGEHVQDIRLHQEEWEVFCHQFYLDKDDVMDIIYAHEGKKDKERELRASSVDTMIDRILKNPA